MELQQKAQKEALPMAIPQFCFECVHFGDCPGIRVGRPRDDDGFCNEFKSLYEDLYEQEEKFKEFIAAAEDQRNAA